MGKKHVSSYTCAQAVALYHSGMKVSKIAEQFPISRKCIMNAIERYEKHGEFNDLNDRDDQRNYLAVMNDI